MALEIIIPINGEDEFEQKIVSSSIEEELTGKEKDSGHWSVDYTLPQDGGVEEAGIKLSGSDSSLSQVEDEPPSASENDIPIPPPWPPVKNAAAAEFAITVVADTEPCISGSIQVPNAPPPPPLTGYAALPSLTKPAPAIEAADEEFDETKCCVVCLDPNRVTEYDDFDYDFYMDVHHVLNSHLNLPCCGKLVCKPCVDGIISTVVGEGRVQISCPRPECGKPFTKEYITANISDNEVKRKYQQFLVDVQNDGKRKTCPKCCHITEHTIPRKILLKERDLKIDCEVCQQEWCFRCHAPWHNDISCRTYQKGSKDFRKWTKERKRGVANCQKCPTCRVYIQRSTGCHHMQCNRCDTEFCYDCGGRFLELGIIDHESTLNVWGCPDNYHKDEPIIRHSVRWGYLTAKLSYLAAYPPVLIGACGLLVVGAIIVLPIYGGFKLYSYSKFKRDTNNRRRRH